MGHTVYSYDTKDEDAASNPPDKLHIAIIITATIHYSVNLSMSVKTTPSFHDFSLT